MTGGCRLDRITEARPIVSIIVVVYEDGEELTALLENLCPFRSKDTELIIVDGGSNDSSLNTLILNNDKVDFWLSEPDAGIYDAMNKGLASAYGEYVIHINAGDRLLYLPLAKLLDIAERHVDVLCCRVLEDDARQYTPRGGWWIRIDNPWHHQGTFYRREAHLGYDPSYSVFGDFEHNQRLSKVTRSIEFSDVVVATHKTDGVTAGRRARGEIYRSIRTNFGLVYLAPTLLRFGVNRIRNLYRPLMHKACVSNR